MVETQKCLKHDLDVVRYRTRNLIRWEPSGLSDSESLLHGDTTMIIKVSMFEKLKSGFDGLRARWIPSFHVSFSQIAFVVVVWFTFLSPFPLSTLLVR